MAARPEHITGGCLCGAIRYKISFPEGTAWPPDSATCQCSICRKFSGSLVSNDLIISPTQITSAPFNTSSFPTYREYASSETGVRGFCATCSSGLTWRITPVPEMLVVFIGTIDAYWLVGEMGKGDGDGKLQEGAVDGTKESRKYAVSYGREICEPNMGNLFWDNVITGVTDVAVGGPTFPQSFPME